MIATLIEAALRSLAAALAVWAGIRAFGIRNVMAQKAAWGLVLAGAFIMPLLLPLAARLPRLSAATVVLPAHPFGTTLPWLAARTPAAPVAIVRESSSDAVPAQGPATLVIDSLASADRFPAPVISSTGRDAPIAARETPAQGPRPRQFTAGSVLWLLYFAVAAALLLRLAWGLGAAFRLWRDAEPVSLRDVSIAPGELRMRWSRAVASPVTIGSCIVLPADYGTWQNEKLRIVLAHERCHVRQGDFYLQLLAGLYAALFWFSPLGWWLKRTLSDLAEAISDCAGLAEAASRASYAQVLLEFAATPRPTFIGVAMARSSRISDRIERLLNDSNFGQAIAGTRRRAVLVALLVAAAVFAASAAVRVEAAAKMQEVAPVAPANPAGPVAPVAAPEPMPAPEALEGQTAPAPAPGPVTAPAPTAEPAPPAPGAAPPAPPAPSSAPVVIVNYDDQAGPTAEIRAKGETNDVTRTMVIRKDDHGDSYVIVRGDGPITATGDVNGEALKKARQMTHGDFMLVTRQGKSYVIDDPATMAQVEASLMPMNFVFHHQIQMSGERMKMAMRAEEMANSQRKIILERKDLMDAQAAKALRSGDLSKEMAELNATVARLEANADKKVGEQDLAQLRAEVGELQAELGEIQIHVDVGSIEMPKIVIPRIDIDKQMDEVQHKLGEAQERMRLENDQKLKSIIDQSLANGKAKPVN